MKKILSLVLAALMIFSVVPAAFAAETSAANGDSAYREALDFLATVDFYQGGAGVADDDLITRWQMALFVARLITGQVKNEYWATSENDSGFADVAKMEDYQKGAIAFAAAQGIINGYDDDEFGPNDGITYRDALTMVVRALGTNYPASGYPWSYIAKARELGLMDGIEGIGWTDELKREVVAQILYNAFFVETNGKTVASDIFGVAADVVIVTASVNVVYEAGAAKIGAINAAGDRYIQVAVANEQGEPAGAKYHILGKDLGLADAAAQNAAVGTAFKVYHKDNFAEILLYEDLNTVYTNDGKTIQIAVNTEEADVFGAGVKTRSLVLNGVHTKIVAKYTNLLNLDRPSSNPKGTAEVKLYSNIPNGAANVTTGTQIMGSTYVMYPDGWIYTLKAVGSVPALTPVGYYSEYLNRWYTYDAATETYAEMATNNAIYQDLNSLTNGTFLQQAANYTNGISLYAQVIASDLDGDDLADRAILRNYRFGKYTQSYNKDNKKTYVTLMTGPQRSWPSATDATGTDDHGHANAANAMNKFNNAVLTSVEKGTLRYTDKTFADGNLGAQYVLYYYDATSAELEIIEVVGTDKTTDTYVSSGYVLGFFQSNNLIYIDDGESRLPLPIGYDAMFSYGAPLCSFNCNYPGGHKNGSTEIHNAAGCLAANQANLIKTLTPFIEQYVTYVVFDGKVVYIENKAYGGDYVVIDSFADVSEEGIKVNAWSTVTDSYGVINIDEFYGWDVGGVDWQAWYQTVLFQAMFGGSFNFTDYLANYIPVKAGEIYGVVYSNGADYNLADAAPAYIDADFYVADGYAHGIKDGKYVGVNTGATNYTKLAGTELWVIRVLDDITGETVKIYGRKAMMGNISFEGVDIYKCASGDYVISGTETELAEFLAQAGFVDKSIKYVMYRPVSTGYDNDLWLNGTNGYSQINMWDVIANAWTTVNLDMANLAYIRAALKANPAGTVYQVIDGTLYSTVGVDMADVALFVKSSKTFAYTGVTTVTNVGPISSDALKAAARNAMDEIFFGTMDLVNYDYIAADNLTYIGIRPDGTYYNGIAKNVNLGDNLENVTLYIFYTADMKAKVIVDYGYDTGSVAVATDTAYESKNADGSLVAPVDTNLTGTAAWEYADVTDTLTITLTLDNMTAVSATATAGTAVTDGAKVVTVTVDGTKGEYAGAYTITVCSGALSADFSFTID